MHMRETGQAVAEGLVVVNVKGYLWQWQSKDVVAALSWWLADDIGYWLLVLL